MMRALMMMYQMRTQSARARPLHLIHSLHSSLPFASAASTSTICFWYVPRAQLRTTSPPLSDT